MKKARLLSALLITFLLLAGIHSANAQSSDAVYVPETGHWIRGEFLRTYNSVLDPLLYFGYPITDDFTDAESNLKVQYFQRARFDLVETSEGQQVKIAPLGELLYQPGGTLAAIPNEGPTCRKFDSGYPVCYAFLQFYDAYDGARWFGQPLSSVEVADNHYVQYFENVRMEWWPEKPAGQRVVLSDLGRIYFDQFVADKDLLKSSAPQAMNPRSLDLQVNVFVLNPLIGVGESQTVYVIVQDQFFRPVTGAQSGVTLFLPNGSKEYHRLDETDAFGISIISFTVEDLPLQSLVKVTAEINFQGVSATDKSWFRVWW